MAETEMMPSFQESDDSRPESDHISDSELPSGLPSPDASDEEDIKNCSDCGITTPYFFNKLREMTQPLFQTNQDLSPSGNTVYENVKDRSKSSRPKKRMGKENGMDSPSGIIERYYGYVPNPRWPKAQQGHSKPFNPKGISKNNEAGIPGIVFRTNCLMDHSYQESDFPELNSLSRDDSSSCIGAYSRCDSTPVIIKRHSLDDGSQDCKSPVTSTPLRHEVVSPCARSPLDKLDLEEVPKDDFHNDEPHHTKREARNRSGRHNNRRRSKKIQLSPLVGNSNVPQDQSLSDSSNFNSSNSFLTSQGQRSLEDLRSELNIVGRSQSLNENSNAIVTTNNKCRSDRNSGSFEASSLLSHVQTNLSALNEQRHVRDKDKSLDHSSPNLSNFEEKHGINNNIIKSPTWSQIASRGSSPVPWNNSSEGPCMRVSSSPLTVDTRPASPSWSQVMKSPVPSPKGFNNTKQTGIASSHMKSEQIIAKGYRSSDTKSHRKSSPAAIAPQGNSFSGNAYKNNLRSKSGSKALLINAGNNSDIQAFSHDATKSSLLVNNSRPSSPLSVAKPASLYSSGKSNAAKVTSAETIPCNSADTERGKNTTKQTIERPSHPTNGKGTTKKDVKQRAKLLTLDNFITPKKTGKENWPNHCSKNRDAFENRFVENIEVSATSPPKKVRPSPIKKLNFSFQGDKNSSSENETTHGDSVLNESDRIKGPVYKRQVSIIRDLDWQKLDSTCENVTKMNKGKNNSSQNHPSSGVVFSLEDYMKSKEAPLKDVLSEDEIETVEQDGSTANKVKQFWKQKPLEAVCHNQDKSESTLLNSNANQQERDCEEEEIYRYYPKSSQLDSVTDKVLLNTYDVNNPEIADPSKVTFKAQLKKYARRYCHIVEKHQISSIADEIHFILQLLTPSQLNQGTLKTVDVKVGWTTFCSVHNSVYFAVHVIKKLRRLFLCLPCPLLHLLAHNPRIKSFSPKLHVCFLSASSSRKHENETSSPLDHSPFKATENGVESFPDTNFAHVFKCQRDNFYALFRQYHDRNGIHPFCMEEQIQYVYDCKTPEQNAVTNLMHLAELYVEHLLQCCLSKADEQRKQMVQLLNSQCNNEADSERLLSEFFNNRVISSQKTRGDAFFVDFIHALRSPEFNEHLKNLLVSKILELNEKSFGCVRNLHSTVIIGDDKTPKRCHDFGSTVLSLCAMAQILGHLMFLPYTSGAQDLPIHQEANMLRMREMVPLPLPLTCLLKQAFEDGHLSLTIPWVVDLLSMMDQAAPKLSVYESLLRRLQYLQRYAWKSLYMNGHHACGLLIVSSISKVFQMTAIPSHLSVFYEDYHSDPSIEPQGGRYIDVQRLVSSDLLYFCCPHLVKSCEPLAVSVMYQNDASFARKVTPLIPRPNGPLTSKMLKNGKYFEEVVQRLGLSVLESDKRKDVCALSQDTAKPKDLKNASSDQADTPYTSTPSFMKANDQIQNKLKINFVDGTPYLRNAVNTTVDLLCGRVEEYTVNTLLKVGSFESKRKVRSKFLNMEDGDDVERVKSQVLIHANLLAEKISSDIRYAFFQLGERTCKKDLPQLIRFLTTCVDEQSRTLVIDITEEIMVQRLQEWAHVQLGSDFFRRIIVREAEKCCRLNAKPVSMFPTDFTQKLEQSDVDLDLKDGISDLQQLSEIMDRALSCGVWYINSLTPGPRPDENFMLMLINDLISCIDKRMVTIDFAFYVMANFLMHLIIQYIMDAPYNWSESCLEAFVKLCQLCEDRKSEDDRVNIRLAENVRRTKNVKVKIYNLVSVFSLQWISKSLILDHTLMVYCQTLTRLVEVGLMMVETLIHKLMKARTNRHLMDSLKDMVDRVMLKVLSLLYASGCHSKSCSPNQVFSLTLCLKLKLEEWGSDQCLEDLNIAFGGLIKD